MVILKYLEERKKAQTRDGKYGHIYFLTALVDMNARAH